MTADMLVKISANIVYTTYPLQFVKVVSFAQTSPSALGGYITFLKGPQKQTDIRGRR